MAVRRGFVVAAVALGAVGCLLLAALAELAVRWRERHRDGPTDMMTTLYYRHARLGRALVRNADYFGVVRTDSLGLRVGAPSPVAAPETLLVLADGGSTTFDVGVTNGDSTWPARLGRLLSDSVRHVRVLNAGVPSYRVFDNLVRFERELHRLRPHVVLQLQGHNDLYDALVPVPPPDPARPDEVATAAPWTRWLERHSLAYGKGTGLVSALVGGRGSGRLAGSAGSLEAGAERFEAVVRSYVAVVHALGSRVVLVEPPHVSGAAILPLDDVADHWRGAFVGTEPALVLEGYARFDQVLQRVAESMGATYLPTEGFALDSVAFYEPSDPIHFSDRGARAMAERLAAVLRPLLDSLAASPGGGPS